MKGPSNRDGNNRELDKPADCIRCHKYAVQLYEGGIGEDGRQRTHHPSAYATGLPSGSFEIVHMRLLLCHLTEPKKVLPEVYRILRPGGALDCQDLHLSSHYCFPESPCYTRIVELCRKMGKRLGVNCNFGVRLPAAAAGAGFCSVEVRLG
jgi:SAM-dependent methyltransferase